MVRARSLFGCASYCFCYLQRNTPAPYPYREPHTRSARPTGRCCGWASSGRKDNPDPIACQALHTPRPQGDQRACHRCCWFVSDFFFTSLGIVCIELGFRPPFTQTHTHTHTHTLSLSLCIIVLNAVLFSLLACRRLCSRRQEPPLHFH